MTASINRVLVQGYPLSLLTEDSRDSLNPTQPRRKESLPCFLFLTFLKQQRSTPMSDFFVTPKINSSPATKTFISEKNDHFRFNLSIKKTGSMRGESVSVSM